MINKVAIIAKAHDSRCPAISTQLIDFLKVKGITVMIDTHLRRHLGAEVVVDSGDAKDILKDADFVIVLGRKTVEGIDNLNSVCYDAF
jgi:NAD kinase